MHSRSDRTSATSCPPSAAELDVALPPMDDWLDAVAALPKADLMDVDTVKLVRDDDAARVDEVTRRTSFSTHQSRSTS